MELFSRALLTLLRVALLAKPLPNDDVHGDSYTKYTNHTHTHSRTHSIEHSSVQYYPTVLDEHGAKSPKASQSLLSS